MKNIYKKIAYLIIGLTVFSACEDEDKNPLNVFELDDTQSPFVRIVLDERVVALGDLSSASLTAVVDDPSDNVSSWSLGVSRESGGMVSDTVQVLTVNSFPSEISLPYSDVATALGISFDDFQGGDFLRFLGTATGTDGTVVTSENFSNNVITQPEQRQAFNFIVVVNCSPISDATIAGTWVIDMQDSFADGWDGAFVTFEIDGVKSDFTFTSGASATFNVDVPAGTNELVISYTSGAFEEEHTYTITTPDGEVRGPFGPSPLPCIN